MRLVRTLLPALALLACAQPGHAQLAGRLPLSLQARIGAGLPTGGFAERDPGIDAQSGGVFEVGALLEPTRWLGVYAGYQQARHGCGECLVVGLDDRAIATGGEAGVQLTHAGRPLLGVRPWVRGGVVRQSLRLSRGESALVAEPGVGYSVGAGFRLPTRFLELAPGVRYQRYDAEFELGSLPGRDLEVSYLTLDLGLLLRL